MCFTTDFFPWFIGVITYPPPAKMEDIISDLPLGNLNHISKQEQKIQRLIKNSSQNKIVKTQCDRKIILNKITVN